MQEGLLVVPWRIAVWLRLAVLARIIAVSCYACVSLCVYTHIYESIDRH